MINATNRAQALSLRHQVELAMETARQADGTPSDQNPAQGEVFVRGCNLPEVGVSDVHLRYDSKYQNDPQEFQSTGTTSLSMHREPDPLCECSDTLVYQRTTEKDGHQRVESATFEPFSYRYEDSDSYLSGFFLAEHLP